jgi:YD repeat-containing protein
MALAIADGAPWWRWCSPTETVSVVGADDQSVFVVGSNLGGDQFEPGWLLTALSAEDGAERWSSAVPALNEAFETVALFVAGEYAGSGTIVLDMLRPSGVYHVGIDSITGEERWAVPTDNQISHYATDGLVITSTAYAGDTPQSNYGYSGVAVARDRSTGAQLWEYRLPVLSADPVVVGDTAMLPLSPEGEPSELRGIDLESGAEAWVGSTGWLSAAAVEPSNDPQGRGVAVAWHDIGRLVAIEATDGSERWAVDVPDGVGWMPPVVAGGTVVVAAGGEVSAYDVGSGESTWSTTSAARPVAGSAVAVVLLGGDAVEARSPDGTLRWTRQVVVAAGERSMAPFLSPRVAALNDAFVFVAGASS